MNTLLHLCKKDFTYAKPWIVGTWFALAISNLLPWVSPEGEISLPFMMIRLLAPAVLVFLTSVKIILCDPFVGSAGFMGTRPVRAIRLLTHKLLLIAFVLVLPAVAFALLHAVCMRVNLTASDWLLLVIENGLYFSLIAAMAVMFSAISRKVGTTVFFLAAGAAMLALYGAYFANPRSYGGTLEDEHLRASITLVAQAFLASAAVAVAASWAKERRIWLTVAVFLLAAGGMVALGERWKWNFVDELSRDVTTQELTTGSPAIKWMEKTPRFGSHQSRESVPYSQVQRVGNITGFNDGWVGKLVKFQSEARFPDGTVWQSEGVSDLSPFGELAPAILPQLGIQVPEEHPIRLYEKAWAWTLFECEKSRLQALPDRRASIRGTGTFQLYQPIVLAELPAQVGASAVIGRFNYRIDRLNAIDGQISVSLTVRGVALRSKGDSTRGSLPMELLFVNPSTRQFTDTSGSGGSSSTGGGWIALHKTVSIDHQTASTHRPDAEEFLKGARLYILGIRYGGNIKLPYEVPEMLLEEKR